MPTHLDQSSYLMSTGLSAVRCRLATRVTLRKLPSLGSFVQLLLALPSYFRSRRDRGLRPLFGFTLKQTKGSSAWRTTYIVLHFIGRVVGASAVFSFLLVFPNRVCVWADVYSLFSARSTDLVDASVGLVVSREALILLMKLSDSPGSSWINVLIIVSYLLCGDLLGWTVWGHVVVLEPTTNLQASS